MYGQMTAGSWIYIGSQGIVQGTYECFAEIARRRFGGSLAGTITLTAGPRRHGRRPAARGDDERRRRALHRGRPRADPAAARDPLPRRAAPTTSTTRSIAASAAKARAAARSASASAGTRPRSSPELLRRGFEADVVTDQTSRARPARRLHPGGPVAGRGRRAARVRPRRVHRARPRLGRGALLRDGRVQGRRARRSSTTATACAARPSSAGFERAFDYPGFVPAYIRPLFCEGKGPFRWAALSGDPADIAATDRAVLEEFPEDEALARWIRMAARADRLPGAAGPDLLARLRRAPPARPALQRDGRERRAQRPDRDRPRPPRLGLGRLALPRDRGDGRRLRRDRRLAAAQRARQHRVRSELGVDPPRRRASASGARSTPGWSASPMAPSSPPRSSTGC